MPGPANRAQELPFLIANELRYELGKSPLEPPSLGQLLDLLNLLPLAVRRCQEQTGELSPPIVPGQKRLSLAIHACLRDEGRLTTREYAGDHRLAPPDVRIAGIDSVVQVHGGSDAIKHPLGQEKMAQRLGLGGAATNSSLRPLHISKA